jgi:arsenate reductase
MGCGEGCPFIPGARVEDWPIEDPKGQPVEKVRTIRDEVRRRVEEFLRAQGWAAAGRPSDL